MGVDRSGRGAARPGWFRYSLQSLATKFDPTYNPAMTNAIAPIGRRPPDVAGPTARFLVATGGTGAGRLFAGMDATVPPGLPTDEALPTIIDGAKRNALTSPLL
jgi:hypothetical protein